MLASEEISGNSAEVLNKKEQIIGDFANSFRRELKADPKSTFVLVLGAGVSLEAGIPTACGWIPLLWRYHAAQDITEENVKQVLKIQQLPAYAYKDYGDDFAQFAEKFKQDHSNYGQLLDVHPRKYDQEYKMLMSSLADADDQRRAVNCILKACNPKITWTYLRIGQLVNEGYVNTILTTNLDIVLIKTLALFDIFPAICDYHKAAEIREVDSNTPQLIYLHGNLTSYNVLNTGKSIADYDEKMKAFLKGLLHEKTFLVSGYAGWDDGLTELIKAHFIKGAKPKKGLYWAFPKRKENVALGDHESIKYIETCPAKTLFEELASRLEFKKTLLVDNPAKYCVNLLEKINQQTLPPIIAKNFNDSLNRIRVLESKTQEEEAEASPLRVFADLQANDTNAANKKIAKWINNQNTIKKDVVVFITTLRSLPNLTRFTRFNTEAFTAHLALKKFGEDQAFAISYEAKKDLLDYAESYDKQRDFEKAVAILESIVPLISNSTQNSTSDLELHFRICEKLAQLYEASGFSERAFKAYEKAKEMAEALYQLEPKCRYKQWIAKKRLKQGEIALELLSMPDADLAIQDAFKLAREGLNENPENSLKYFDWERILSDCYVRHGQFRERQRNFNAALKEDFLEALKLREKHTQIKHSDNLKNDLATVMLHVGEAYLETSQLKEADAITNEALSVARKLLQTDNKDWRWLRLQGRSYRLLGKIHAKRGLFEQANTTFGWAQDAAKKVAELNSQNIYRQVELADVYTEAGSILSADPQSKAKAEENFKAADKVLQDAQEKIGKHSRLNRSRAELQYSIAKHQNP